MLVVDCQKFPGVGFADENGSMLREEGYLQTGIQ
jgi:hypothetical protein